MSNPLQALLLTNEYPPNVYGGAGVHVEYLARELARLIDVDVRAFGEQDLRDGALRVRGFQPARDLERTPSQLRPVFGAFDRSLGFLAEPVTADIVHCHTWYAHLGGILAKARTASRWSSRPTRSSLSGRGSSSSSAAATTRPRGSSGRPSRWPMA